MKKFKIKFFEKIKIWGKILIHYMKNLLARSQLFIFGIMDHDYYPACYVIYCGNK